MITYARQALPRRLLNIVGVVLVVMLQAYALRPARLWPLEGCALGLLAGAAAWCFDEASAAVVDAAPRHLAWRTAARLAGPGTLAAWWIAAVWTTQDAFHGHAIDVMWHGIAAVTGVVAYVTCRRSAGVAVPGTSAAAIVVASAAFLALARPWPDRVPLFPYVFGGPWGRADLWWTAEAIAAGVLLAVVLTDRHWSVPRNRAVGGRSDPATGV